MMSLLGDIQEIIDDAFGITYTQQREIESDNKGGYYEEED